MISLLVLVIFARSCGCTCKFRCESEKLISLLGWLMPMRKTVELHCLSVVDMLCPLLEIQHEVYSFQQGRIVSSDGGIWGCLIAGLALIVCQV